MLTAGTPPDAGPAEGAPLARDAGHA